MFDKLSIGIKTFCRPKALYFCLNNFALLEKYLGIQIIIADDSNEKYKKENQNIINTLKEKNEKINIKYLDLPFDTGLSYGRNRIVEKCETDYIMIIDDSRTININTQIFEMVNFLEETKYDLIGGIIRKRKISINSHYSGIFTNIKNVNNKILIDIKKIKKQIKNNYLKNVFETNICLNVFVARTKALLETKWCEELKVGEHEFFFYNFYKNNFKCAITNDVNFIQSPNKIRIYPNDIGNKFRNRAYNLYEKYIKLIWK